ncbi:MAG: ABC transporter permease subunit [Bacilli bacterium]|nr:ABC transporter permease subunit [Bacilli bacterium]
MNKKFPYYTFYGVVFIFVIWLIASVIINNVFVLPSIKLVFTSLFDLLKEKGTYVVLFATVLRLLVTVAMSFLIALLLASLAVVSKRFTQFIRPLIILLKTIPVASIIIILLIIVGHERSPLFITALVVLPILYEGILGGMHTIDKTIIEEVKMISNINHHIVRQIFIPLVFPAMITALIQSIGLGLKVMVMSEFIAQPNHSIGKMILIEKQHLEMARVFAWTLLIIVIIMAIEWLIYRIKKHFVML